jgi:hypothetical protein
MQSKWKFLEQCVYPRFKHMKFFHFYSFFLKLPTHKIQYIWAIATTSYPNYSVPNILLLDLACKYLYLRIFLRACFKVSCLTCTSFKFVTKKQNRPAISMQTPRGRRCIALIHSWPQQYMGWVVSVTSRPRTTPGEWAPCTHWKASWEGFIAGLETKARGKILCLFGNRTPFAWSSSLQSNTTLTELAQVLFNAVNIVIR